MPPVVGIVHDTNLDRILIGKKADLGGRLSGKCLLPGGGQKEYESPFLAVFREVMEETNTTTRIPIYLAKSETEPWKDMMYFLCYPLTFDAKAGEGLVEVRWVPRLDVYKECDPFPIALCPPKVHNYIVKGYM